MASGGRALRVGSDAGASTGSGIGVLAGFALAPAASWAFWASAALPPRRRAVRDAAWGVGCIGTASGAARGAFLPGLLGALWVGLWADPLAGVFCESFVSALGAVGAPASLAPGVAASAADRLLGRRGFFAAAGGRALGAAASSEEIAGVGAGVGAKVGAEAGAGVAGTSADGARRRRAGEVVAMGRDGVVCGLERCARLLPVQRVHARGRARCAVPCG